MHRLPRAATTTEWQEWRSRVQRSYSHGSSQGDVEQDAELCEAIERARRQVERVNAFTRRLGAVPDADGGLRGLDRGEGSPSCAEVTDQACKPQPLYSHPTNLKQNARGLAWD